MALEINECPKCGSTNVRNVEGIYLCMNCKSTFSDSNHFSSKHEEIVRDEAQIEKIKLERERDQRKLEQKKADNKSEIRTIIIVLAFCALFIGFASYMSNDSKEFTLPVRSADDYKGIAVEKVVTILEDIGFDRIETIPENDLNRNESSKLNTVSNVTINGETEWVWGIFSKKIEYPRHSPIKVYYHSYK